MSQRGKIIVKFLEGGGDPELAEAGAKLLVFPHYGELPVFSGNSNMS